MDTVHSLIAAAILSASSLSALAADTVHITYSVTSDWGSGFQGQVSIRNDATWTISAWRLEFNAPFTMNSLWDARTPASGVPALPRLAFVGPTWDDGALSPGETASFGFTAAPGPGGSAAVPTSATLNAQPVAINADSPAPGQPIPVPPPAWPRRAVIPYVDATAWPPIEFDQLALPVGPLSQASGVGGGGVKFFNLGFIVAIGTTCSPAWGGFSTLAPASGYNLDRINTLRGAGGDVIVSFGGAANVELGIACASTPALVAAYQSVIDAYGLTRIDFDIEGGAIADHVSTDRRSAAIAQLQAAAAAQGRTLRVWFTLPVLPSGLTADGVYVLTSALAHNVQIEGVNVMAMDYGASAAPNPSGHMGDYATQSGTSTRDQLRTAYAAAGHPLTIPEAWRKIGITPMIGQNDALDEVFTLAAAAQLRDFAIGSDLGGLFYWSLGRDKQCPSPQTGASPSCSGLTQADYAFAITLAPFGQPTCRADFNASGALSVQDIFDFINAWFAGDARADFDAESGLQVNDIFAYLNAWFAGC